MCMYVCECVRECVYLRLCRCMRVSARVSVCVYVRACACVCTCVCTYSVCIGKTYISGSVTDLARLSRAYANMQLNFSRVLEKFKYVFLIIYLHINSMETV